MSFQITYAKRAAKNIHDEAAQEAINYLCKALEEASDEIKKLKDEMQYIRSAPRV